MDVQEEIRDAAHPIRNTRHHVHLRCDCAVADEAEEEEMINNSELRITQLEKALGDIRKAAASSQNFTNRLQFIHERAGVALAGEEWNEEWKAANGYAKRCNILAESDQLKVDLAQLQHRIAELEADRDAAVRKGLELAISVIPGGSICDPQQVADAIRAIGVTLNKDAEQ